MALFFFLMGDFFFGFCFDDFSMIHERVRVAAMPIHCSSIDPAAAETLGCTSGLVGA
jgi:hypothetical protein